MYSDFIAILDGKIDLLVLLNIPMNMKNSNLAMATFISMAQHKTAVSLWYAGDTKVLN